jgi:hypothetical protein
MATAKKTTKTTKTTTKKTVKKTAEKLDLATFTVTQSDLASIIGIATSNITPMVQAGLMVKDEDGRFNLRDAVSGYCKRMKDRKEGKQSKSDIDTETAKLKLDNLRIKNRDWRMTRDRQVATEILNKLVGAMQAFREQAKLNPALVDAIDDLISNISDVDIDGIPQIVEGGDEEDDDV